MNTTHKYDEELPAEVTEAAAGVVVITQDGDRPHHDVWMNQQHIGSLFDETAANLARGNFAAWSPKGSGKNGMVGFFDTKEEAGEAIALPYRPVGPRGMTEPSNRNDRYNYSKLPADRQAAVAEHAARMHAEGRLTAARAWREALNVDWRDNIATPDEDTLFMCIAVNGGEIHTTAGQDDDGRHVYPLCRTMGQNSRLTKYRFITGRDLTCRTCIRYRENRAAARARKVAGV
ncbi:hypothetical protein ACGF3G_00550 [Streptomyces sp. NPDC048179]|uniref:hypothetical protein n=1 Tax=Streptomyces sp. NPDC048179 TaxID=3365506 RepID=UPI003721BEA0